MMWNFLRNSSDVIAAKDAEIADLKALVHKQTARAERAEAAHRIALETAAQRAVRIIKLEADLTEQSTKITTLSNLNAALKRKYEPVRGPHGRWVSKRLPLYNAQVSA